MPPPNGQTHTRELDTVRVRDYTLHREVARTLGINLLDIERYKRVFDSYDKNKSGVIEQPGSLVRVVCHAASRHHENEFRPMMCHM